MNDIEVRIRELLNESVDAELGPRRPAPPFDTRQATQKPRRWGPWATPLLAAAAVAALIGGTVAVAHVAHSDRHRPPATSIAPTPAPSTHGSAPATHASKPSTTKGSTSAGTGSGSGDTVHVPSDLKPWILAQAHPQLPSSCRQDALESEPVSAHLTGRPVAETIALVTCLDGTASTPYEIDVYGAVGAQYGLVYRVPAGTTTGGIDRVNGGFSISGNTVTAMMSGYAQKDSLCCPSSHWKQTYTFEGTNVSQGPLVQTSGPNAITFTSVGPVQLGMTAAQVHAAEPSLASHPLGKGCTQFDGAQFNVVLAPPTNRVIDINAPSGYRTDTGIGTGSTRGQIRAAYAGRHIEEASSQGGQVVLVQGPSSWLGFVFGSGTTVKSISVGDHGFAAQQEPCVGSN